MKSLFVLIHLGMGDAILCNGLIRHLAETKSIVVPAYAHNFDSVKFMFRDLENVKVIPVSDDAEAVNLASKQDSLNLGHYYKGDFDLDKFDQEFYRHANVPFEYRWSKYKILIHHSGHRGTEYEFVHDDPRRGFNIDRSKCGPNVQTPFQYDIMFNNAYLIQNATKIHCINSSFLCFVDSMEDKPGQELYFHKYARPTVHPKLKRDWIML